MMRLWIALYCCSDMAVSVIPAVAFALSIVFFHLVKTSMDVTSGARLPAIGRQRKANVRQSAPRTLTWFIHDIVLLMLASLFLSPGFCCSALLLLLSFAGGVESPGADGGVQRYRAQGEAREG